MIIFLQNDKNAFCDPGLNLYLIISSKEETKLVTGKRNVLEKFDLEL